MCALSACYVPFQVRYRGLDEIRARGTVDRLLGATGLVALDRQGARESHGRKVN